jgi:pyruvate dehydrogenase E2 component (dihydrolipoamide acetyltransferase)
MAISVIMPALEMAQETGKLLSWRKKEGDRIAKGEPLLEIETDKAVVEIEAPGDGFLAGIKAQEGDVIPVGQIIAWLLQPGEAVPADSAPSQTGRRQDTGPARQASTIPSAAAQPTSTGARLSPKARRLAREHGVDISQVRGSGPSGEIVADDIIAFAKTAPVPPVPTTAASADRVSEHSSGSSATVVETLSAIGRLMAERTTQSWTTVPHFFITLEVDAEPLVTLRGELTLEIEKRGGLKPTHTDLLVAIVARVLVQHPRLNASWIGNGIKLNPEVNIGIAMAVNDGVVATVIQSADTKHVTEIARERQELTERARAGKLQPSDIADATFTISNLGMYNVDAFTAIIVPPQAGILAVGRITDRVVPVEGKPGIRPMLALTLSTDHRVADGARAAAFLNDVATAIREPRKLLR